MSTIVTLRLYKSYLLTRNSLYSNLKNGIFAVCLCKLKKELRLINNKKIKTLPLSFFLFFALFQQTIFAQFTEVINSNRPGFSESPYSVGTNVYQLEAGLFYRNTKIVPTFTIPESFGTRLVFRTSFFLEKLELNTNISFQKDKVAFKNIFTSQYSTAGLSEFTIGAKYLVYQPKKKDSAKREIRSWKRKFAFKWSSLIPTVAIYAGVNTNLLGKVHKIESITPKIGVLLQSELKNNLNLITNIYYDKFGSDFAEFSYILTGTYSFNPRWSTFLETQGIHNKYIAKNNYGVGLAYLFNRNLQFDSSVRYISESKTRGAYVGFGASYRLDRHVDQFKEIDEEGNEIKDLMLDYKKGFFGRIWGKMKGLLKKNDQKVDFKLPPEDKSSRRSRRTRKKSTIDEVKKLDAKQKKKEAKRKAKEERKKKKAAAKAKRKADKEKEKQKKKDN